MCQTRPCSQTVVGKKPSASGPVVGSILLGCGCSLPIAVPHDERPDQSAGSRQDSSPNQPRRSNHLASSKIGEIVSAAPMTISQSFCDSG